MAINGVDTLMVGVKEFDILTKEEEFRLAEVMKGDDPVAALEARNTLITANLRFVTQLAHGYAKSSTTPLEDYVAVGLEAMVKNADKFEPNIGKFITFIKPWIKKAFSEFHYNDSMVTVPRHKHIAINKVTRAAERLVAIHGPFADITDDMIAAEAGMAVADVADCFALQRTYLSHVTSLDAPIGSDDDSSTYLDMVADTGVGGVPEGDADLSDDMNLALASLTSLESAVLLASAGIGEFANQSAKEIAAAMGVTAREVKAALESARRKTSTALATLSDLEADLLDVAHEVAEEKAAQVKKVASRHNCNMDAVAAASSAAMAKVKAGDSTFSALERDCLAGMNKVRSVKQRKIQVVANLHGVDLSTALAALESAHSKVGNLS